MNISEKNKIKNLVISLWDNYKNKEDITKEIESGYIFGEYANNKHYRADDIFSIVKEVDLEKNPLILEEQIPEI